MNINKKIKYPLTLAVHKVRGLAMDKIVVSLDLLKQRNFNSGQIFLALSRVTLFNFLYIVQVFSEKVIRADSLDLQEYVIMFLKSYLSVKHVIGNRNIFIFLHRK